MASIELLLASPRQRYVGRPSDGPEPAVAVETPDSIEIRQGLGVVGDRYFNKPAHRGASVTVFALESLDFVRDALGLAESPPPEATRRNIITTGIDVDALVGRIFRLDTGAGPVLFRANRPANPCAWMDHVLAPGAFRALRGRGGVRCEPLSSGILRLGAVDFGLVGEAADLGAAVGVTGEGIA